MRVEIMLDKGVSKDYESLKIVIEKGELVVYGNEKCLGNLTINDLLMSCLEKKFNKVKKELEEML